MKKLYTILAAVLVTASTFGQSPEKMSYQAVVRDSGDNLVTSQVVGMRISILQGTTAVYVETQTPTTNVNGLVTLEIGGSSATVVSGTFSTIDWSTGTYFIKTETDPTGDTTYTITGTSQLLSVPYALHSKTAGSVTETQSLADVVALSNSANGQLKDVTDPTEAQDAATKAYVDALIAALEPEPAAIGELREGGIVFWVNPLNDQHGLVCALEDYEGAVEWGCGSTDLPNVPNVAYNGGNPAGPGAEIGDGEDNTIGILAGCSSAPAALAARSYGPEWFLPSILELNQMYLHRATLEAVSGFYDFSGFYWSSTEYDSFFAWEQDLGSGNQYEDSPKQIPIKVRAVRAF
jgi:hypothetical protein